MPSINDIVTIVIDVNQVISFPVSVIGVGPTPLYPAGGTEGDILVKTGPGQTDVAWEGILDAGGA